ncbi:helix-turn-helix domain-containing protein [Streptomyces niveus]|uniref:helix-turn-helix domain-containing protein n=1 Tax=Streptomyces niveus TaxID=193462 RepID=UPI0033F163CC
MGEGVLRAVPGPGPGRDGEADEPLLRDLVGAALRRARLRQGRTLRDVADQARVSLPYLSEIERGRKEASSEVLAAVCGALGLRLADLVGALHIDLTSRTTVSVASTATTTAKWGRPRRGGQASLTLLAA